MAADDLSALPLVPGSVGDAVRDLQRRLGRAGFASDGDRPGTYGPATETAVRAFQEHRGLRVDGRCGEQTWSSLVEAGHALGDRLLYLRAPMLRGDDVGELQRLLGRLGFDAGRVDGILGPRTAGAVTEFQRNAGLTTDGICGPDTVAALRRYGRSETDDQPGIVVASLREAEGLRRGPRRIAGLRVVVADAGGVGALASAVAKALADRGAVATVDVDPVEAAAVANAFDAELFLSLCTREAPGAAIAYFATEGFESIGGRRLAALLAEALDAEAPRGMRLPVLRETRMPAVVLELGPPAAVVAGVPRLAAAVAAAVERWAASPVDA
jgi:N-acetylmuramoyl-L-alanine amidase